MLKKLINYCRRKKQIVGDFNANRSYLVPGRYKFDITMNYLYLDEEATATKASELFDSGYLITSYKKSIIKDMVELIMRCVFYSKLKIKDQEIHSNTEFRGTILLPARTEKDIKIFDLQNNKVVIVFSDEKEYNKEISNYEFFADYFPMPKILYRNHANLTIIEEYIDYKGIEKWDDRDYINVFEDVLVSTSRYLRASLIESNYVLRTPKELFGQSPEDNEIINYIWANLDCNLKDMELPFVKLHGDFCTTNILISKNDNSIKYIDFETTQELVFFYDIFKMIWSEFVHKQGTHYREYFTSEKMDDYLKKVFEMFNMEFKREKKIDYLNIFFLVHCMDKWLGLDDKQRVNRFNNYKSFIKNIKSMTKNK